MAEDQTNQTVQPASGAEKPADELRLTIDEMPSRRIFNSIEDVGAYLSKLSTDLDDFDEHPMLAVGFTEDDEFDPAVYDESMQIAVVKLTKRSDVPEGRSTVKAIVVYPSPSVESLLSMESGKAWVEQIIQKELNHVAVRNLRLAKTSDDIIAAVDGMPRTIADYITSQRDATGGILESYNQLWKFIKTAMGKKFKGFALRNFSKKELRKSIENAAYAAAIYPEIETRTNKQGEPESLFDIAAQLGVALSNQEGHDPAFFERALETRSEREFDAADDDEDVEFDIDEMAAELATDDDDESSGDQPQTEQPAEQPAPA